MGILHLSSINHTSYEASKSKKLSYATYPSESPLLPTCLRFGDQHASGPSRQLPAGGRAPRTNKQTSKQTHNPTG